MKTMHLIGLFAFSQLAHAQSLPPIWDGPTPQTLEEAIKAPLAGSKPKPANPASQPTQPTTSTPAPGSLKGAVILQRQAGPFDLSIRSSEEIPTGNYLRPDGNDKDGQPKFKTISKAEYESLRKNNGGPDAKSRQQLIAAAFDGNPFQAAARVKKQAGDRQADQYALFNGTMLPETRLQDAPFTALSGAAKECLLKQSESLNAMVKDEYTKYMMTSFDVTRIDVDFRVQHEAARTETCGIELVKSQGKARLRLTPSIRRDLSVASCETCSKQMMLTSLQKLADAELDARRQSGDTGPGAVENPQEGLDRLNDIFDNAPSDAASYDPYTDPRRRH